MALNIYTKKTADTEYTPLDKVEANAWIDAVAPTEAELKQIAEALDIDADLLKDALDEDEMPRVDIEDNGAVNIIVRVPYRERGETLEQISTLPLGVAVNNNILATICLKKTPTIGDFLNKKVKRFSTGKRGRFLLQIMERSTYNYLKHLSILDKKVEEIETTLKESMKNEEIMRLMDIQKTLVYFNNGAIANQRVLERVMRGGVVQIFEEDKELLEDIIIDNKQALAMIAVSGNILNNTMNSYSSIISNNLGSIMKVLTLITIVLMIPTLVASIYGMNIELPLQNHDIAFYITIGLAFALSLLTAGIFWRLKWL